MTLRPARILTTVLAAAVLGGAAPAAAQNASTPGALELYATPGAIGVRLAYAGDDNGNATARVDWRLQGSGAWIQGMAMTRITNRRWAASVLWLQPDTPYEVRAVINDPDGGGEATGTARTRTGTLPTGSGRAWWVSPTGSDANSGTQSAPMRTIQAAMNRAQPGDEVRCEPGIYYETVDTPRSGTATQPIRLVANAPGVILDGSDPAMMSRNDWRDDGGGVFSIPFTGTTRLVCADSLQRLYHQASLAALQADANDVSQGWTVESGRLWVKLEGRDSPAAHVMHIARYDYGVYLDVQYWQVSGLEVRYYGTTTAGSGIYLRAASDCVISDNHVHTIGGKSIYLRVGAADNVIERNLCRDPRTSTWPWDATKAHDEEAVKGISNRGGRGNVIRLNTVEGTFDGIDVGNGETDENVGADCDMVDNLVTNVSDDAFEPETIAGINVRVIHNTVNGVFNAISVAPLYQGPMYVLYNTFLNYARSAFKFSLSGTGETWIMHNTAVSTATTAAVHPSGPYSNIHFRNNILVGTGIACVNDDAGEAQSGNDYDGDLVYATSSSTLFRWKGVNYGSLSALRSGTGFEAGGRAGDPSFVSLATGDVRLNSGSPAIDAAIRYPGINDTFSGAGPDMGAWEVGGPDVTPPGTINDLRVSSP